MIQLCDGTKSAYGKLYHVSEDGRVTVVQYGPGQLQLAKEYIPRNAEHYLCAESINVWRKVIVPGHVRVIDHDELPKEIKLYLFLLGD